MKVQAEVKSTIIDMSTNKDMSFEKYDEAVSRILKEDYKWKTSPDYQFVQFDYERGMTVNECVEGFEN